MERNTWRNMHQATERNHSNINMSYSQRVRCQVLLSVWEAGPLWGLNMFAELSSPSRAPFQLCLVVESLYKVKKFKTFQFPSSAPQASVGSNSPSRWSFNSSAEPVVSLQCTNLFNKRSHFVSNLKCFQPFLDKLHLWDIFWLHCFAHLLHRWLKSVS